MTKPCEQRYAVAAAAWPPRTLTDWIQHDHRYLALGLELAAANKIAVRVLDHPVRLVRSEFCFSHRALLQNCREHIIGRRIGQFRIQEQADLELTPKDGY